MGENRPNSSKMIHSDGVQQVSGKCTSKTNVCEDLLLSYHYWYTQGPAFGELLR